MDGESLHVAFKVATTLDKDVSCIECEPADKWMINRLQGRMYWGVRDSLVEFSANEEALKQGVTHSTWVARAMVSSVYPYIKHLGGDQFHLGVVIGPTEHDRNTSYLPPPTETMCLNVIDRAVRTYVRVRGNPINEVDALLNYVESRYTTSPHSWKINKAMEVYQQCTILLRLLEGRPIPLSPKAKMEFTHDAHEQRMTT